MAEIPREPFRAEKADGKDSRRLVAISPQHSGLTVVNSHEDPRMWAERYLAARSGATGTGLAAGDFNGDGWPDLFIGYREKRNRLYLNLGDFRFHDATEQAGILPSEDWTTGVTAVDIEGDGDLDLYVCFHDSPNRLYLNNGSGYFEDYAYEYGLGVADASNAAFFADYDRDGDLDVYLQTNRLDEKVTNDGQPDYLFRNDGYEGFVDVTEEAGIRAGPGGRTLGHSALWHDFDQDGWEDLYVANDFARHDFLYRNLGDGRFREVSELLPVVPYSAMGSDCGDVNNDGQLDLLLADMAATSYLKHVVSMGPTGTKTHGLRGAEMPAQVMKNALLLNRGAGNLVDVAYALGLAATDWTWSARLADLDNDGWQDAVFTDGMTRQYHNVDLSHKQDRMTSPAARDAVFRNSPTLNEWNLVYRNQGGGGFSLANEPWGFHHLGVSYGLALSDLDRDGDLDIAYTNFNDTPSLWRNDISNGHAVQIRLEGRGQNRSAVGAVVTARFGGSQQRQRQKLLSNRGYQSSDEHLIHFGLGAAEQIDSLEIRWPDGSWQQEGPLETGFRYTIKQDADATEAPVEPPERRARFVAMSYEKGEPLPRETQLPAPLYPLQFKLLGEARLQADLNRDGLEDRLRLGQNGAVTLSLASANGEETNVSKAWGLDRYQGMWTLARLVDFDSDGHLDLVLGNIGLNNQLAYRAKDDFLVEIHRGRFRSSREEELYLTSLRWDGEMRILPSLMDVADYAPTVPRLFRSFQEAAEMSSAEFMDRSGFEATSTLRFNTPETLLLRNEDGQRFRPIKLPRQMQYGALIHIAFADLNRDQHLDAVALLKPVSPHARSPQSPPSFLWAFLGDEEGNLKADDRPPFPRPLDRDIQQLELLQAESEPATLTLQLEGGILVRYTAP